MGEEAAKNCSEHSRKKIGHQVRTATIVLRKIPQEVMLSKIRCGDMLDGCFKKMTSTT